MSWNILTKIINTVQGVPEKRHMFMFAGLVTSIAEQFLTCRVVLYQLDSASEDNSNTVNKASVK